MKIENEVLVYEAPQVETIEVEVEKGFATSEGIIEDIENGDTYEW